jgi:RNA polymerase sigma factor (sigma-70 family)
MLSVLSIDQSYYRKELLLRIAEGDQPAFRQLVELYNGQVYRFVATRFAIKHAALIEEVVWDVFLQLWLTRETLPELGELENYLFILARNKGLNALKKEVRELERRKRWETGTTTSDDAEQLVLEDKALDLIDKAVAGLPEQQQKVWVMSRKKAMTYMQIAAELNISRETVKSYLQAANLSIKKYVISHLDEFPNTILIIILFFLESQHPLS